MLTLDAEAKHSSENETPVRPSEGSFFYKSHGPTPPQTLYPHIFEKKIVSFMQLHGLAAAFGSV